MASIKMPQMNEDCEVAEIAKGIKQAIHSGCRMLAIREHSRQQIRLKLIKKGFGQEVIKPCIDYLIDENWLSETRFCNVFIRSRASKGQGLVRIESELVKQNIHQSTIDQQLDIEGIDWQQICERVLVKKIRQSSDLSGSTIPDLDNISNDLNQKKLVVKSNKQKAKLENFLRYRGFSAEEIRIAIKKYVSIEHREFK